MIQKALKLFTIFEGPSKIIKKSIFVMEVGPFFILTYHDTSEKIGHNIFCSYFKDF